MKRAWWAGLILMCGAALAADPPREIDWMQLLPPEDVALMRNAPPVDHTRDLAAQQVMRFNTVAAMDGVSGRIAGYIVPIDQTAEGELTEFFVVPFFGACIHVPPPPPNQIVHAKLAKPVAMPDMWGAYWVTGTIKIERTKSELGSSAYSIDVTSIDPWQG